jgi:acetyl-CoA carboxylase biotin carboxylase subunit
MLRKVLIANRGEIAVRIARACRELGIASVAVYSDADREALHASLADEAVRIGPAPARESYLKIEALLAAARATGADAVHPGYGFLSENAEFAAAVAESGRVFIGPSAAAIRAMGQKTEARARMQAAHVPVVPGYPGGGDARAYADHARALGYPVLVKAASGGGGKGMRIVRGEEELSEALESARREAEGAFGSSRVYLEKYLEAARHIEIQVLADSQGHTVHLFERECSVQRRHQKVIEESPSPFVDPDLRARMGEAAVAAARAVGYTNAGTVEFLVDRQRSFYFLEMNTRLQVEHPVTECVTGVDLVQAQLRIAAGEPLPFAQRDLSQRGHAIECRVYAEDPAAGHLPVSGRILALEEPWGPGVRVDSGVQEGQVVGHHYDPMLSKLIAWSEDRDAAIRRMDAALRRYAVLGLTTNIPFLRDVLAHDRFRRGEVNTQFLEEELSTWSPPPGAPDEVFIAAALSKLLGAQPERVAGEGAPDSHSPWRASDGFRPGGG